MPFQLRKMMQSIRRLQQNPFTKVCGFHTDSLSHSKKLLHNPKGIKIGWAREVVGACLPFTSDLISSRGRSLENIGTAYCVSQPPIIENGHPAGRRRIDDSWLEVILPFAEQAKLRESMMLDDGKTIRYGKLFELLDALAADVAYRHVGGGRSSDLTIVTASVDGMKNFVNINIVEDIKMQGYITYTGKSSMEVRLTHTIFASFPSLTHPLYFHTTTLTRRQNRPPIFFAQVMIDIIATREDGEDCLLAETTYIMVARNGTASAVVPGLLLANDEVSFAFTKYSVCDFLLFFCTFHACFTYICLIPGHASVRGGPAARAHPSHPRAALPLREPAQGRGGAPDPQLVSAEHQAAAHPQRHEQVR